MLDFDVLIVGAGLSGIGAAYHLQTKCPGKSYAILEARGTLGGTWELFRYPGIRSDSDMFTLGYSFRPWTNPKAIADGASILAYLRETAEAYRIDRNIRYGHRVVAARWSTKEARWTVDVEASGERVQFTCRFLFGCAGYYDYEKGYVPDLPGRETFRGRIVHPQHWDDDVATEGKRIVVIGSGATAVTLVPALAKRAAHVTMLQRSPTYIIALPERDPVAQWMRARLSTDTAYAITRWKNVLTSMAFYAFCRRFPRSAKRVLVGRVRRGLRGKIDAAHFTPAYDPWDQRLCLVPDGDLFAAIRERRASVVTGHIDTFTEHGIRLQSGDELGADLVITATGLRLEFFGGITLEVDGKLVDPARSLTYKGFMLSDVPNLAVALGYTNASWTLKCELTSEYVCRLLRYMDEHGHAWCCPRRNDPSVEERPLIDFTSGYVRRAIHAMPRQGSVTPWRLHQNYVLDLALLRHSKLEDSAMEFGR